MSQEYHVQCECEIDVFIFLVFVRSNLHGGTNFCLNIPCGYFLQGILRQITDKNRTKLQTSLHTRILIVPSESNGLEFFCTQTKTLFKYTLSASWFTSIVCERFHRGNFTPLFSLNM